MLCSSTCFVDHPPPLLSTVSKPHHSLPYLLPEAMHDYGGPYSLEVAALNSHRHHRQSNKSCAKRKEPRHLEKVIKKEKNLCEGYRV